MIVEERKADDEPGCARRSRVALLTNTPGEPPLGAELRLDLASADQVDLLCAFIHWHGIRILATYLRLLDQLHPGGCWDSPPPRNEQTASTVLGGLASDVAQDPVEDTSGRIRWWLGTHCTPVDRAEWWQAARRCPDSVHGQLSVRSTHNTRKTWTSRSRSSTR